MFRNVCYLTMWHPVEKIYLFSYDVHVNYEIFTQEKNQGIKCFLNRSPNMVLLDQKKNKILFFLNALITSR